MEERPRRRHQQRCDYCDRPIGIFDADIIRTLRNKRLRLHKGCVEDRREERIEEARPKIGLIDYSEGEK